MQPELRPDLISSVEESIEGGVYRRYIKRALDFILSLSAIIVLSPVLLIVAVLVRIKLGAPVIFKQERPGRNEKIFTLYKFRSMTNMRDEDGELLPDDLRATSFGNMLRKASLDELPELFNILKGDMSFVGPRPLLVEYIPYYTIEERRRHDVRPGLTGLAQVSGRSFLSWEEKFALDNRYVTECGFYLDCKIILKTMVQVLSRKGIADIERIGKDRDGTFVYHEGRIFRRLDVERSKREYYV